MAMSTGTKIALGAAGVAAVYLGYKMFSGVQQVVAPQPPAPAVTMTTEEQVFYPDVQASPVRQPNPYNQYPRGVPGQRM
jgi:hypothetical protein